MRSTVISIFFTEEIFVINLQAIMGQKRSYDEEGLQELSFKHPKQLDCTEHATTLPEIDPSNGASQKTDSPGKFLLSNIGSIFQTEDM